MNILQWANEHGDASKTYYMLKTKIIVHFSLLVRANDLIKTCGKNLLWCSKRDDLEDLVQTVKKLWKIEKRTFHLDRFVHFGQMFR